MEGASSSATPQADPGLAAPVTPTDDRVVDVVDSPRHGHGAATRIHGPDDDGGDASKRAKAEANKKEKVDALMLEQQEMNRAVKFGSEE